MGSNKSSLSTKSKKGVEYSNETNEIVSCLFCRIARGESPANQLWYQDDKCSLFIPRQPAARLHFLVVPIEHIRNAGALTEEHLELLEHMKTVAVEQLRIHSQSSQNSLNLRGLHPPPVEYPFNRGTLPVINTTPYEYQSEPTERDASFVLCFHPPPFNSIDHLHLHAIQKPYRTFKDAMVFFEKSKWHLSLEDAVKGLSSKKSKL